MAQVRDIGIDVQAPTRTCNDAHCPFHGSFPVRGAQLIGQVVSAKMDRSVVVRREYTRYDSKYERYEKRTSKYTVHAPPCFDLKVGDVVRISECRPISKTKAFVVVEARGGELEIRGDDAGAEKAKPATGTPAAKPKGGR